ncbi:MAG: 1-acyl-sn-glycerol-3-phosphate acyltransferase [Proteobacteria bacterium]|nr:1-acyl-sn-glycerol-3-phosphate acyltransferase [Pseudomonadota bacterium]MCP4916176.1 1-acyl-sn-glycerol-3-phosphate acyltransferase [Pseudomonadota bacterium]
MTPTRSPGMSHVKWGFWLWFWTTLKFGLMWPMRVRIKGLDEVPKTGGAMLLPNHTTFFDVLICFWGLHRPSHGIGSEQVFRLPGVGWFLEMVGGIPYTKGAKDGDAVRRLVECYEGGNIIGMFPEGLRSWTGAPLPIRRGTGRLVKSLGCPLLFCRVDTGFLQHPRWATWPRLVPWTMEYELQQVDPDATADEINEQIARGIAVDPELVELPEGSWGFRLADGLPDFLWACPECFAMESLTVQSGGNHVACSHCARRWRVDLRSQLVGETQDATTMGVALARDALDAHFSLSTHISCHEMEVTAVRRGQLKREPVVTGAARMTDTGLEIHKGDEVLWFLPYEDMVAVLLQFRNALQIRVDGANYQLVPHGESTLRWHHFLAMHCKGLVG